MVIYTEKYDDEMDRPFTEVGYGTSFECAETLADLISKEVGYDVTPRMLAFVPHINTIAAHMVADVYFIKDDAMKATEYFVKVI